MGRNIKIIVGSFLFAIIIISIKRMIGYFITGEFGNILNIRSIILFIIIFIICVGTTMVQESKTN